MMDCLSRIEVLTRAFKRKQKDIAGNRIEQLMDTGLIMVQLLFAQAISSPSH